MQQSSNILFIITDQLRYDALGCHGNALCSTPHIDSLARDGVMFSNAFTTISLCSPARATMMTGLYPHKHGQLANMGNFNGVFDTQVLECENIPRVLKRHGYRTGYVGKWHLPAEFDNKAWPFDLWERAPMGDDAFDIGRDVVQRIEWGGTAPFEGLSNLSEEEHQEYRVADRTIEMLDSFRDSGSPFALIASFFGPHFPYSVPAPYYGMFDGIEIPQPDNFNETFENKP